MNIKSIRWRLPLSYAAIALLAALALGSVMLLVLDQYYTSQERDYLQGNAVSLQPMIEQALNSGASPDSLKDTLTGLSFLSQTRIRILDKQGKPLADSGVPEADQVVAISSDATDSVIFAVVGPTTDTPQEEHIVQTGQVQTFDTTKGPVPGEGAVLMVGASPYGYSFISSSPVTSGNQRSNQVVRLELSGSLGTLEISKGPAYGRDILRSVSLAWAGAGVVAILLAALAGWFASRRFTHPVLALTEATQRMEAGELSARAALSDKRPAAEFQVLAHSFNGMAQRVEDTVSTLQAFVADAAHELHTPLTALHTNLELAADESDGSRRALYLEHARQQGARLESLVNGLLDLSRIESGRTGAESVLLDLNGLLVGLGEQFASQAEQAERNFTITLPADPVLVRGNMAQLQRVAINLFENALKFTPAGGSISLELACSEGNAMLTVADSGIGIPPEDLPHLFERFHRGRNAASYPGSGLGLAIVKAMVNAHGGRINAESRLGQGTKMILRFPVREQE